MSTDIVESLPERKHAPAAAAPAKGKPEAKKGGGSAEEGSEKRIRQAVYDIRYRARREDIDLKAAYSQYMSNSNLSQQERAAVREKLFGKEGGGVKEQFTVGADEMATSNLANALYKVFVEDDQVKELELAYLSQLDESSERKYKVRVTDKNGKSYVRYADRVKITQLRQNPNIQSVEMTEHGEPYEGERKKTPGKLDPVGKEDADIDNDGDHDKNDKYLLKRRKAIGSAIKKRAGQKLKEDMVVETAKAKVDNYKKGENGKTAVTVAPVNSDPTPEVQSASKRGIYAHLELNGSEISESRKRLLDVIAEKAAYKKKKKKKSYSEAVVNTADCEKKPEEKKDMRGYYAKINTIKNKIRAMGAKNPMLISDPDEVEKSWDKGKKDDEVKEEVTARQIEASRIAKERAMSGRRQEDGSKINPNPTPVKTGKPLTKKPAKVGKEAEPKKEKPRYNPFKDGRTPTSASQTTGP